MLVTRAFTYVCWQFHFYSSFITLFIFFLKINQWETLKIISEVKWKQIRMWRRFIQHKFLLRICRRNGQRMRSKLLEMLSPWQLQQEMYTQQLLILFGKNLTETTKKDGIALLEDLLVHMLRMRSKLIYTSPFNLALMSFYGGHNILCNSRDVSLCSRVKINIFWHFESSFLKSWNVHTVKPW